MLVNADESLTPVETALYRADMQQETIPLLSTNHYRLNCKTCYCHCVILMEACSHVLGMLSTLLTYRPPSPPKRTRFDDNIQYQEIRPYKPERASFAYKSPDRRVSSNIKSTSAKSSTKRKRRASDEGEEDTSVELEIPPTTSRKPHKAADILSILGTPIDLPSFRPNGSGSKKVNGYQALPGSSTIQNKGPSVIEIDEDKEDTSDSRSASPELPEILPHHSPKKIDVKGKGRAVDLPPEDSKGEKVMRVPIEAKFRSLEELADFEPDVRPTYALWVLARCAILGSGIERLTLDGIISRIAGKYLYYKYLAYDSGSEERSRFANALKSAMKTKACFTVTKEAGLREWFGVDIKINPALKKEPQRRRASLPIFEETAGSELSLKLNGSTSRLDGPVTSVSTSLPQHRAMASVPLKSVPPVPPPPKQPEYTIQRPEKVPSAEVEIFATSLMDLKNAPPLDDEPSPIGEQKEADKDKPAASSKVNHLDVLGKRIGYELWVPLRAALLGSPFRKLKVNAIIQDLLWKYPSVQSL